MKDLIVAACAGWLLLASAGPAAAQIRKLSDQELDKVTAGGTSPPAQSSVLTFQFSGQAGRSHTVEGTGSVSVVQETPSATNSLVLRDSAQQNLQSLINITAVNSKIQVLVNLNVNINSTVGTLRQINLTSSPGP